MNLYSFLFLAIVFAENEAQTEKRFDKVSFDDQDTNAYKEIGRLAKLVQMNEDSNKDEAESEKKVSSMHQDTNIYKETAKLAKLIHLVNRDARNKAKNIHLDESLTNQDNIHIETAKLAKLIHLVNKDASEKNRFDKLSSTATDGNLNRGTSKLAKLFHQVNNEAAKNKAENRIGTLIFPKHEEINLDDQETYKQEDEKLAALIDLVKQHQDDKDVSEYDEERIIGPDQKFGVDYFGVRNDDQPNDLKSIMRLIQSNYEQKPEGTEFRIHVISNPEVLKEYKKTIKKKPNRPSFKNSALRINFKDFMSNLRRNAVFRLDGSSKEKSAGSKTKYDKTKSIPNSLENNHDKLVYNKKSSDHVKLNFDDVYNEHGRKNSKRKEREDIDSGQNNAWDVITKQYNWNDKPRNKKKHDNSRENTHQMKIKKVTRELNDDWDKKVKNNDDWGKKVKSNDDWDKKVKNNDDWDKKVKRNDDWDKKVKNNDDWDKKVKRNDDWDKKVKNNDNWDRKVKNNDDWDRKVVKNDKVNKQKPYDDWDLKTTKAKKTFDDWPTEKNKNKPKKQWDSGERKKSNKKHNKDLDVSYERPKKEKISNDWDIPLKITVKNKQWKKKPKLDWNKDYYEKPRPKKSRDSYDQGGFLGRTPIPFIGKRGIYAEK